MHLLSVWKSRRCNCPRIFLVFVDISGATGVSIHPASTGFVLIKHRRKSALNCTTFEQECMHLLSGWKSFLEIRFLKKLADVIAPGFFCFCLPKCSYWGQYSSYKYRSGLRKHRRNPSSRLHYFSIQTNSNFSQQSYISISQRKWSVFPGCVP